MRCVVQRVSRASVVSEGTMTGAIEAGFLCLVGAEVGDEESDLRYIADKVAGLRVFEDDQDKMNLSIQDVQGKVLLVSQFTLLGDARHGRRPSFSAAERPEKAAPMLDSLAQKLRDKGITVETGRFQTHMEVSLVNNGPVTILLDSRKGF